MKDTLLTQLLAKAKKEKKKKKSAKKAKGFIDERDLTPEGRWAFQEALPFYGPYQFYGTKHPMFDTYPTLSKILAQKAEASPASEQMRTKKFYHGTDSTEAAEQIWKDGIKPDLSETPHDSISRPVAGRIYMATNLREAIPYMLGGAYAGTDLPEHWLTKADFDPFGYMFVISGKDLADVQPDEDQVGEAIHDRAFPWVDEYLSTLRKEDPVWEKEYEDEEGNLVENDDPYLFNNDLLQQVDGGEYDGWIKAGHVLLPLLTDDEKYDVIEKYGNVAHLGTVKPTEMWKFDKRKSAELKSDGSNFFQLAEKVNSVTSTLDRVLSNKTLPPCYSFEFTDPEELRKLVPQAMMDAGLDPYEPFWAAVNEDRLDLSYEQLKQNAPCEFFYFSGDKLQDAQTGMYDGQGMEKFDNLTDFFEWIIPLEEKKTYSSMRAFAKATLPEDSELMEFYFMADAEGWREEQRENALEEWNQMDEAERREVIPDLIHEGYSDHFNKNPQTEEEWNEVRDYYVSMRERQEMDQENNTTMTFFEKSEILTNPTLVRFQHKPLEGSEFKGYAPEGLGLTYHDTPGMGDLAFAFDKKTELKTPQDWKSLSSKYGKFAYEFKVPYAVKAWHISDYEWQVVFDVTTVKDLKQVDLSAMTATKRKPTKPATKKPVRKK